MYNKYSRLTEIHRQHPSSPTPSSRTHNELGPSRVVLHLLGSLAHMLARVRACQLRAPSRVASPSTTCERRKSGPLSPLANTSRSHACQYVVPALTPHALGRTYVPVPMRQAIPNLRPHPTTVLMPINSRVVAISACTPNHPPTPLGRVAAHALVPCLVSLSRPSASLRCDTRRTVVASSFPLSHKKRHHHHHSHLQAAINGWPLLILLRSVLLTFCTPHPKQSPITPLVIVCHHALNLNGRRRFPFTACHCPFLFLPWSIKETSDHRVPAAISSCAATSPRVPTDRHAFTRHLQKPPEESR
jgi:hypothetical protein